MNPALRRLAVALLLPAAASCGSDAPSGPTPVATVHVSAASLTLAVGETVQLTATTYDSRGGVLTGRAVTWSSGNTTVATVSSTGVVTAVSPGSAIIEATSEGTTGRLTIVVLPPAPPISATGRLYTIAGLPPGPLTATFRIGTATAASASVAPDGTFGLTTAAPGDVVDLVIDGSGGLYLPSLLRWSRSQVPAAEVRIVLAPRRWTIPAGTYTAQSVDVSPNLAFTPPCTTAGDINCDGYYPKAWSTGIKLWDELMLPAPLAFDHGRTSVPIAPSDSAAFWDIVRRMEDDLGRPLFRPATTTDLFVAPDGWSNGAVMVRVDATLPPGRGFTNWRWDGRGVVFAAVARFGSVNAMRSGSLVTHELLHAVGLKHSCAWPTVMGGYGCPSAGGLTLLDVAYARVALQVAALQRANDAYHNLYEAMQGERVVMLGLPPVSLSLAQALSGARAVRVGGEDGAH